MSTLRTTWVPPLDIALDIARHTLTRAEHLDLDLAGPTGLAEHLGALTYSLRQVLDALDTEQDTPVPYLLTTFAEQETTR